MATFMTVISSSPGPCRPLLALAAMLALAGCASISEDECRTMDWRTVGYEDGAAGHGPERLTWRRQACAKHGVSPDLDAYLAGRAQGLREFCVPANGFRVGAAGQRYGGACPPETADSFLDAYEAGRQLWYLERKVIETQDGIAGRRQEVERIDRLLSEQSLIIVRADSTSEERADALLTMKNLTDRRAEALVEMDALERALPAYEADLEAYRATLPYPGF